MSTDTATNVAPLEQTPGEGTAEGQSEYQQNNGTISPQQRYADGTWDISYAVGRGDLQPKKRYAKHPKNANYRADNIRDHITTVFTNYRSLAILVAQAWVQRDYLSLGYESWEDYCDIEFGVTSAKLTKGMRDEVVPLLRQLGMDNTAAIATFCGVDRKTIQRQENPKPVVQATVEPVTVDTTAQLEPVTYDPEPTATNVAAEPEVSETVADDAAESITLNVTEEDPQTYNEVERNFWFILSVTDNGNNYGKNPVALEEMGEDFIAEHVNDIAATLLAYWELLPEDYKADHSIG